MNAVHPENIPVIAKPALVSQLLRSALKALAELNMYVKSVTRCTSQQLMSPLNACANENLPPKSVIKLVSQYSMSVPPYVQFAPSHALHKSLFNAPPAQSTRAMSRSLDSMG